MKRRYLFDYQAWKINSLSLRNPESFYDSEWGFLECNGITNGYGPKGNFILKYLIRRLTPAFQEANAKIHDWNYYIGGTEKDRRIADNGFCKRLVNDSLQSERHSLYYLTMSICFYISVRLLGYKYFKYKNYAGEYHKHI